MSANAEILSQETIEIEEYLNNLGVKKNYKGTDNEFWSYAINLSFNFNYSRKRIVFQLNGYGVIKVFDKLTLNELKSLISLFSK